MAANTKKNASLGQKSGLFVNAPPVIVERSIIVPALPVKGKWRRPFPLLVPRVVVGTQREGNNDKNLHLLKGSVHCSIVSGPRPLSHEFLWFILPSGLPRCIQRGTENSVCLKKHTYTRRSLLVTVVRRCWLTLPSRSGGTGGAGESVLFTLLPGCRVTLGSSQPLHFSLPQFL